MTHWFSPGCNGIGIVPISLAGWIAALVMAAGLGATLWIGCSLAAGAADWLKLAAAVIAEAVIALLLVLITFDPNPRAPRRS